MKINNPFKSATKTFIDETAEYQLYEKAAEDIDANIIDKGIWTKAFTRAKGDKEAQKAFYIEMIVEHYKKLILAGEELDSILKNEIKKETKKAAKQKNVQPSKPMTTMDFVITALTLFCVTAMVVIFAAMIRP